MKTQAGTAEHRELILQANNVSRETTGKLDLLATELVRWQAIKNLVGPTTLSDIWRRHIADSLQLTDCAPDAGTWLDVGSGGGFPGLVVAIVRTEKGLGTTHLVESNGRKCAFLRHIVRLTEADAVIHEARIEDFVPKLAEPVHVVSARAVASLEQLLAWTNVLLRKGTLGIFPKGQDVDNELRIAATSWDFTADLRPSLTDRDGRIVLVRMSR
jgi:16S rRNA (guanine527-N7)-methyltransferase